MAESTASLASLSHSHTKTGRVANRMDGGNDGHESDQAELNSTNGHESSIEQAYASVVHEQVFAAISLICIFGFGLMYIRQGHKYKKHKQETAVTVELMSRRSIALENILDKRNKVRNMFRDDWSQISDGHSQVGKFMSTNVVTVLPNMTIDDAASLLKSNGYRRVLVVDQKFHLLGVLSKRDIKTKSGKIVADIMTDQPKTTTPDTDMQFALSVLLQNRVTCLPVVQDGLLVGLLSTSDLFVLLQCLLASLEEHKENASPV